LPGAIRASHVPPPKRFGAQQAAKRLQDLAARDEIFATRACMFTAIIEYALLQLPLRPKK
jgi:hypothetical protein